MSPNYRICISGNTSLFDGAIRSAIEKQLESFELNFNDEVELLFGGNDSVTTKSIATVGLFFGAAPHQDYCISSALQSHHPIIPVVSNLNNSSIELPEEVSKFNAIANDCDSSADRIASSVLECLGLMPSRRRVFLSYKRNESREVALQLFDQLSSRQFDVFLDTHEIRPGAVFQDALWHQICESDVLLMIDTSQYFSSRWTVEEFAIANLKKAAILRVAYPSVSRDKNLSVTESIVLTPSNFKSNDKLTTASIDTISDSVENIRSKSVAVRQANLIGTFQAASNRVNAEVEKPGPLRKLVTTFSSGQELIVYPVIGVPNSELLNNISNDAGEFEFAVLYDHLGVLQNWQEHLEWLGNKVNKFRWIKAEFAAKELELFSKCQ